jgi:catechol 2,3-dioxygenase-like lactoylglutathione lyase family enzyme
MKLHHVALQAGYEEKSDIFFTGLLGCEKLRRKNVQSDLAGPLFGLEQSYDVVDYGREGLIFEVFFDPTVPKALGSTAHVCLQVEDREEFASKARELGFETRIATKGESWVLFVLDHDGNLFEIK